MKVLICVRRKSGGRGASSPLAKSARRGRLGGRVAMVMLLSMATSILAELGCVSLGCDISAMRTCVHLRELLEAGKSQEDVWYKGYK
jgi:hypothetical protein